MEEAEFYYSVPLICTSGVKQPFNTLEEHVDTSKINL